MTCSGTTDGWSAAGDVGFGGLLRCDSRRPLLASRAATARGALSLRGLPSKDQGRAPVRRGREGGLGIAPRAASEVFAVFAGSP